MKKITKKDLKECGIDARVHNCPVMIGPESGKALEMGSFYGDSIKEVADRLKPLIEDGQRIYVYEEYDIGAIKQNHEYILRFCNDTPTTEPIILKSIEYSAEKLQDFLNMLGPEAVEERLIKDFEILQERTIEGGTIVK